MRKGTARWTVDLMFALNPDGQGRRPRDPTMRTGDGVVQPAHLYILSTGWPDLVIRAHTMDTAVITLLSPPAATLAEVCVYHRWDTKEQRPKCGSRGRESSHAELNISPEEEVVM